VRVGLEIEPYQQETRTRIHAVINGRHLPDLPLAEGATHEGIDTPSLPEADRNLLQQWGRIGDPIMTLSQVARFRLRPDMGPDMVSQAGCALVGIGTGVLTGACFFAPSLVTCGSALVAGGTFLIACT
jgi:hypothetical protein